MKIRVGEMNWRGQAVPCPECAANADWTLVSEAGQAWAVCGNQHRVDHPLIYPALVDVVAHADDGASLRHRLENDEWWYPHTVTAFGAARWRSDDPQWSDWQELEIGREHGACVARWFRDYQARNSSSLDHVLVWGSDDPARTSIELEPGRRWARPQ